MHANTITNLHLNNMSTKKYIKSHSDDQFEKVTGIKLYEVDGQLGCRITPTSRMLFAGKQYMARFVAASIYLQKPIGELKEVDTTCGVKNCVLPAHILVGHKNLKVNKDGRIESPELEVDTPDADGFFYGLHPSTWAELTEENKALARKGEYNSAVNGWVTS